jgi:hypothetical protein
VTPEARDVVSSLRWTDTGLRVLGVKRLQVRKDSAIDAVTVERGTHTREVIAKQHRTVSQDGRPPSELARHEFEVLATLGRDLAATTGGTSYGVPAPLLLDEALCTVVMERANGEPLDRIISAARRRGAVRRLAEPLRNAGAWLRMMQLRTRSDEDPRPILESLLEAALRALGSVAAADPALRLRQSALVARLHELHSRAMRRRLPLVGYHGDYWPGNVFISKGHVEVIDFEGFGRGLPLQDVVYLVAYLERLPLAVVDFPLLRAAFLSGYSDSSPDESEFELFRIVDAIHALARRGPAVPSGFKRWISRSPRSVVLGAVR